MSRVFVVEADIFEVDGLDVYDQMVYVVLKSFVNKAGQAFPSYATIAKLGRMGKTKARECVLKLTELGLIKKQNRTIDTVEEKKRYTSNLYTIPQAKGLPPRDKGIVQDDTTDSAQDGNPISQDGKELNKLTKPIRTNHNEHNKQRSAQSSRYYSNHNKHNQTRYTEVDRVNNVYDAARSQAKEVSEDDRRKAMELLRLLEAV